MTPISTDTLKECLCFNGDLLIDKGFVILPCGCSVNKDVISALTIWNIQELFCDGSISLQNMGNRTSITETVSQTPDIIEDSKSISSSVKKVLEDAKSETIKNSEKSRLSAVQNVYNEYMNYINYVYTRYATHRDINQEDLSSTIKDLCIFIKENRRYVLRIVPSEEARNRNFLVIHSMRSTVLAITIGLQLHMSLSKLIELGIACMLHEIGMIRLPPQLYLTDKPLSTAERAQIATHPIIGYNIMKDLKFPLSVQLGILEHHEKENGTGYPRHLTKEKISTYAKIIAVACSFEAITAPRHYKAEKSTFQAMVEMLQDQNHLYDGIVIKALICSLSLYPIGAYVFLSNGKIAQVTDVNPDTPKNPIVQILNEKDADGLPLTIQTNNTDKKIDRVLSKKEIEDVMNSLKKTAN